jgi:hypothetical protein
MLLPYAETKPISTKQNRHTPDLWPASFLDNVILLTKKWFLFKNILDSTHSSSHSIQEQGGRLGRITYQRSGHQAWRFVLISLSIPEIPMPTDTIKRDLRFRRIGLSATDAQVLQALLISFRRDYASWRARIATNGVAASVLVSQRDDLVQQYSGLIAQSLSPKGQSALTQYVTDEKQNMRP